MTMLTPLPAIAVVYFLYAGLTQGFTPASTMMLLAAVVLFVLSLKRTDATDPGDGTATAGERPADERRPGGETDEPPTGGHDGRSEREA